MNNSQPQMPEVPVNGEIHLTPQVPRPSFKERIAQAMLEHRYIDKTGRNEKQSYDYIEARVIQGEVGKTLAEKGIILCKRNQKVQYSLLTTGSGAQMTCCHIEVEYGLQDVYSDQVMWYPGVGEGWDNGDKASSKATTCARKLALIDALCLGSGDDPEAERNEQREGRPAAGKLKVQREQPRKVVPKESQEPDVIAIEEANWLSAECKRYGLDLQKALKSPAFKLDSAEQLNRAGFVKLKAAIAKKAAEKQAAVINPKLQEREAGEEG